MLAGVGVEVVQQTVVLVAPGAFGRELAQRDKNRQKRFPSVTPQPQFGLGPPLGADDGQVLEQRRLATARIAQDRQPFGLL